MHDAFRVLGRRSCAMMNMCKIRDVEGLTVHKAVIFWVLRYFPEGFSDHPEYL